VPTIRGVIFDLDGTLVDSNDAHILAWVEALAEFGWNVTQEQVRPLVGMGSDKLLPALAGVALDSNEGHPVSTRRQALMARFVPQLRPFPGAVELVEALRRRGLRIALASSATRPDVDRLLAQIGLENSFDAIVSAGEATHSKPDPDIVESARAALGLPASECVMIGDTRYDLEAARRAEIPSIAFLCGGMPEDTLGDALAIYEGPADLLEHLDASPLV
jgi:HAD superfamily hydrolase (TIGR01509 family)